MARPQIGGECVFRPIPATEYWPANDGELNAKKGSGVSCLWRLGFEDRGRGV